MLEKEVEHGVQMVLARLIGMRATETELRCHLGHFKKSLEGKSAAARGFLGPCMGLERRRKGENAK